MLKSFPSFCALISINDFNHPGRVIPMRLTGIQRAYNAVRSPRDIILKPRKVYMTTLEFARDLWWFLTKPGTQTVIVCQSEDKHRALRRVTREFRVLLESLRKKIGGIGARKFDGRRFDTETDTEFVWLDQGSSLTIVEAGAAERTATKAGRGGVIHRLHVTEAAFFEHGVETLTSLLNAMPQRLDAGEAVIESTPNGAHGYYYERWQKAVEGVGDFRACFFPWYMHEDNRALLAPGESIVAGSPEEERLVRLGVSPEAIKWHRRKVADQGERKTAQEYPSDPHSCFLLSGNGFFDPARIHAMLGEMVKPIATRRAEGSGVRGQQDLQGREVPMVRVWRAPDASAEYVVAVDTSSGEGGDRAAAVVIERGTGRHMATIWGQLQPWELAKWVAIAAKEYNWALIAVERQNHGSTVLRALDHEQHYPRIFVDADSKSGFSTNAMSRPSMLDTLERAVRTQAFVTNDEFLLSEMRTFVVNDRGRPEAASGSHDDIIMATAIGWHIACMSWGKANLPRELVA